MSAPQTNIDKQKRRHRGPLFGIAAAVAFGVMLMAYWLVDEAATADSPGQNAAPAATIDPPAPIPRPDAGPPPPIGDPVVAPDVP